MDDNQMLDLRLSRRDVGRLLVGVRERRRKLERGLAKFADNFDPQLGANMKDGFAAYTALEKDLMEAMGHEENNHSRRAGRNPQEREARD